MDIVYILGPGSTWGDNELLFSLRSLEMHFSELGEVFLVGHRPAGIAGVQHISTAEQFKNPLANLTRKLHLALKCEAIGERFLLMNDDFWLTHKWGSDRVHHMGPLSDVITARGKNHDNFYYRALVDCVDRLQVAGVAEPLSFELHCPLTLERTLTSQVLEEYFPDAEHTSRPGLFRSFYGNSLPPSSVTGYMADAKMRSHWRLPTAQFDCLSADDFSIHGQWARMWFKKTYPAPSRFETSEWRLLI